MFSTRGVFKGLHQSLVIFLLIFSQSALSAQDSTVVEKPVDTVKVKVRDYWKKDAFDDISKDTNISGVDTLAAERYAHMQKKYRAEEFNYQEEDIDRLSFWAKLKRRLDQFLDSLFPRRSDAPSKGMEYVLVFGGIIALVVVVYKLLFSGNTVLMRNKNDDLDDEPQFIEKNLERVDLESYIQKAIDSEKFELAIRYLQLANLQALAKRGYIDWDYRKTNNDFLNEIKNQDLKKQFQETTSVFNYVWFGEFEIDTSKFERYKLSFLNFRNQIDR